MKPFHWFVGVLCLLLMVGCGSSGDQPSPTPSTPATLPPPQVRTTISPDAQAAAKKFLDAWQAENYDSMYAMLSEDSRQTISLQDFSAFYSKLAIEAALDEIQTQVISTQTHTQQAEVSYQVVWHSRLVGDISRDIQMNLIKEGGGWQVQWDAGLALPELQGGNSLLMEYRSPERGLIYDRDGGLMAAPGDAVAIGLNTGEVNQDKQDDLLSILWRIFGLLPDTLAERIDQYRPNGWYLAIGDLSTDELSNNKAILNSYSGVTMEPFNSSRYYYDNGVAPHVVGYASAIQEDEVDTYKRLGYNVWSERVGRAGLEKWGENLLSGGLGGRLTVVTSDGAPISVLADTPAQPADDVYTTIDRSLQLGIQSALAGFRGAIVVLERDTGRVLAMTSSPSYDPNLFDPNNFNRPYLIDSIFDPDTTPWLNRATQGLYPLGSVFKIITMSAALESGLYTPASEYYCDYTFTELPGLTLYDWTYQRFLEDEKTKPSGQLTLPEGLMRSCNPYFMHIGLDLYDRGMTQNIAKMANGFGLGSLTGIQIDEEAGNIPFPGDRVEATSLAVGQGDTLVTPLQVADFVAAVGNGGRLFTPSAVEKVVSADGRTISLFSPEVRGTLPISAENLKTIQDAMTSVVSNSRGTAYYVLSSFSRAYHIPIAGKTGTAETGDSDPHAWFAGYTYADRENKPDIAVAVVVENVGEGSEFAAPIFKRVLEIYFTGSPRSKYPWESQIGLPKSPEPEGTPTPEVVP